MAGPGGSGGHGLVWGLGAVRRERAGAASAGFLEPRVFPSSSGNRRVLWGADDAGGWRCVGRLRGLGPGRARRMPGGTGGGRGPVGRGFAAAGGRGRSARGGAGRGGRRAAADPGARPLDARDRRRAPGARGAGTREHARRGALLPRQRGGRVRAVGVPQHRARAAADPGGPAGGRAAHPRLARAVVEPADRRGGRTGRGHRRGAARAFDRRGSAVEQAGGPRRPPQAGRRGGGPQAGREAAGGRPAGLAALDRAPGRGFARDRAGRAAAGWRPGTTRCPRSGGPASGPPPRAGRGRCRRRNCGSRWNR